MLVSLPALTPAPASALMNATSPSLFTCMLRPMLLPQVRPASPGTASPLRSSRVSPPTPPRYAAVSLAAVTPGPASRAVNTVCPNRLKLFGVSE